MTADELSGARGAILDLAQTYVGKCAHDSEYLDLIAPADIESPAMRASMAVMSSCALVVRGLWRMAGLQHPRLDAPYVIGHAVADVVQIAHDKNALLAIDEWDTLQPGDVVIVDGDKPTAHVYTVKAVEYRGLVADVTSIDGGQRIGSAEGILEIQREVIESQASGPRFTDRRSTWPVTERAVSYVVSCDRLFE